MVRKAKSISIKQQTVKIWQVLGIFLLIAFLLRFKAVADPVASVIAPNDPNMSNKLQNWASITQDIIIGWILITLGNAAMAVPFVGIPLIVAGAIMVVYAFWRIYGNASGTDNKPEGINFSTA